MNAIQKKIEPAPAIEISAVSTPAERRAFIRAGAVPYADDPNYVAPLEFEVGSRLNPNANPALKDAPHQLFIAYRDGAAVGRISAMINPLHLQRYKDDCAHFGFLEAIDDPSVFADLLGAAEEWAKKRGMKKIAGPFSFSVNEECGLLVDGFDTPPYVMMPHGRPYYAPRVEAQGYGKAMDMHALSWIPERRIMPEKRARFIEKTLANPKIRIRNIDMRRFAEEIRTVVDIYNDAWSDNWGFVPMTEAQVAHMASELKPIIEPHNVVFCELDGRVEAFALALPNINEAIREFDGRLLPFNWAKLLWRLKVKKLSTARMPLMGVRKKLQGKPVGIAFAYKMIDMTNSANIDRGVTSSECSWILETNKPMLAMLIDMGCKVYKTYRIYERAL
jgi:GNAT superfamily N-acetyltransferase